MIGDNKPGFIYRTIKINIPGYPLRPIISKVRTPTYQLTKTINDLLTPYLSHNYSIKYTKGLIEIFKTHKPYKGIISSLDIENLFTNIPVLETINIIINNIYHHPTLPPFKINSNTLHKITLLWTTEIPFYDPRRNIFIQKDGIAMGSVLGPIFSNSYMSALENKVFNTINKPDIYSRYADDIHLLINSTDEINTIQGDLSK